MININFKNSLRIALGVHRRTPRRVDSHGRIRIPERSRSGARLRRSHAGFVLAELLVVVFVIATLTAVIIVNFSGIRDELALKRTVYQFAQDVRRAQEMAMSSTKLEEAESCSLPFHFAQGGPGIPLVPLGTPLQMVPTTLSAKGYGIYVDLTGDNTSDNKSYKLYADTIKGDDGCEPPCYEYYNNGDCIVKTIAIQEKGVIIQKINNTTFIPAEQAKVSINFKPPSPEVNIKWLQEDKNEVEVVFALESDPSRTKTKTVSVSRTGLIEIK